MKTTCDFDAPFWQLLHCGGLGFQIEHHLFPTISICHFPQVRANPNPNPNPYLEPHNPNPNPEPRT